eukprot:scaffold467_cov366-Pavlova_lutheri.AAC.1
MGREGDPLEAGTTNPQQEQGSKNVPRDRQGAWKAWNDTWMLPARGDRKADVVEYDRNGDWKTLGYEEILARAKAMRRFLRQVVRCKPGDRIAVLSSNSASVLEIHFAASQEGLIVLNLNVHLTPDELAHIVKDSEPTCCFLEDEKRETIVKALQIAGVQLDTVWLITMGRLQGVPLHEATDYEEVCDQYGQLPGLPCQGSGMAGYMMYYTSGTTGTPKGVVLSQSAVHSHACGTIVEMGLSQDDVWGHFAPMFHLVDAFAMYAISMVGGRHVIPHRFNALSALAVVEREGVTCVNFASTMLTILVSGRSIQCNALHSMRILSCGGSPLPPAVASTVIAFVGCEFFVSYGMTECCGKISMSLVPKPKVATYPEAALSFVCSSGRPFCLNDVRVVDAQKETDVVPGSKEVGEVWIRGSSVFTGYWQVPLSYESSFAQGWFRTGDLAYLDSSGFISIVDRAKDMILCGGENVYCAEVEAILHRHEGVSQAAVFGIPDELMGEIPCAAVTLKDKANVTTESLKQFCARFLSSYKIPGDILIVDSLPLTGSGKVTKSKLKSLYSQRHRAACEPQQQCGQHSISFREVAWRKVDAHDLEEHTTCDTRRWLVLNFAETMDVSLNFAKGDGYPCNVLSFSSSGFDVQVIEEVLLESYGSLDLIIVSMEEEMHSSLCCIVKRVLAFADTCLHAPHLVFAMEGVVVYKDYVCFPAFFDLCARYNTHLGMSVFWYNHGQLAGSKTDLTSVAKKLLHLSEIDCSPGLHQYLVKSSNSFYHLMLLPTGQDDPNRRSILDNAASALFVCRRGIIDNLDRLEAIVPDQGFSTVCCSEALDTFSSGTFLEVVRGRKFSHVGILSNADTHGNEDFLAFAGCIEQLVERKVPSSRSELVLSDVSKILEKVSAKVMGHHVALNQPLMDQGMNSMMAVQLTEALERELSTALPATLVFDFPTIEDMAASIATAGKSTGEEGKQVCDEISCAVREFVGFDLDERLPLLDNGLTSISAVALSQKLSEISGVEVPSTLVFDYPNLESLKNYFSSMHKSVPVGNVAPQARDTGRQFDISVTANSGDLPTSCCWDKNNRGEDCIDVVPLDRWQWRPNGLWALGGFLDAVDMIDAVAVGLSAAEAEMTDPQQRRLLHHELILRTCNTNHDSYKGVYVGISMVEYPRLFSFLSQKMTAFHATGSHLSVASGRISYTFGYGGPAITVDTACSASLVATHMGKTALSNQECNQISVGGVNMMFHPQWTIACGRAGMLSADSHCKTMDISADGYVRSEACILFHFEPAGHPVNAQAAILKGSAVNQDGRSSSLTAPNGPSQQKVIGYALGNAGSLPANVVGMELHGTGTALGDPIEVGALWRVLAGPLCARAVCLSSTKSIFGHAEPAAGILGLLRLSEAVSMKSFLPVSNLRTVNPYVARVLESSKPLGAVAREPTPQFALEGSDVWGVSAFAFQGTNAHALISTGSDGTFTKTKAGEEASFIEAKRFWVVPILHPTLRGVAGCSSRHKMQVTLQRTSTSLSYLFGTSVKGYEYIPMSTLLDIEVSCGRMLRMDGSKVLVQNFVTSFFPSTQLLLDTDGSSLVFAVEFDALLGVSDAVMQEEQGRSSVFSCKFSTWRAVLGVTRVCSRKQSIGIGSLCSLDPSDSAASAYEKCICQGEVYLPRRESPLAHFISPGAVECLSQAATHRGLPGMVPTSCGCFHLSEGRAHGLHALMGESRVHKRTKQQLLSGRAAGAFWLHVAFVSNQKLMHSGQFPSSASSKQAGNYAMSAPGGGALKVEVLACIQDCVNDVLGEAVKVHEPLMASGMDSLGAVEIVHRLRSIFHVEIPETLTFDYPTISAIYEYISLLVEKEERLLLPSAQDPVSMQRSTHRKHHLVSIVSQSARMPHCRNHIDDADLISVAHLQRWDPERNISRPNEISTRFGGFFHDVHFFDASTFGISLIEGELMDPQQRIILEEVLNAMHPQPRLCSNLDQTSCVLGIAPGTYYSVCAENMKCQNPYVVTAVDMSVASGRISYTFGLHGPSISVNTACSSSLVAFHLCIQTNDGSMSHGIAGGVQVYVTAATSFMVASAQMLAADGRCKTVDAAADGYVRGEAVGIIRVGFLHPLSSERNASIGYLKSLGTAVNQDGRSSSLTAPHGPSQERVIHTALNESFLENKLEIQSLQMHGTGTSLGDPIEIGAITRVLQHVRGMMCHRTFTLASWKTSAGHAEAAAGVSASISNLLNLQDGQHMPLLHLRVLNPFVAKSLSMNQCSGDSPFAIPRQRSCSSRLIHDSCSAGLVSSFAFQGTNAHVVFGNDLSGLTYPFHHQATRLYRKLALWASPQKSVLLRTVQCYKELQEFDVSLNYSALAGVRGISLQGAAWPFKCVLLESFHAAACLLLDSVEEVLMPAVKNAVFPASLVEEVDKAGSKYVLDCIVRLEQNQGFACAKYLRQSDSEGTMIAASEICMLQQRQLTGADVRQLQPEALVLALPPKSRQLQKTGQVCGLTAIQETSARPAILLQSTVQLMAGVGKSGPKSISLYASEAPADDCLHLCGFLSGQLTVQCEERWTLYAAGRSQLSVQIRDVVAPTATDDAHIQSAAHPMEESPQNSILYNVVWNVSGCFRKAPSLDAAHNSAFKAAKTSMDTFCGRKMCAQFLEILQQRPGTLSLLTEAGSTGANECAANNMLSNDPSFLHVQGFWGLIRAACQESSSLWFTGARVHSNKGGTSTDLSQRCMENNLGYGGLLRANTLASAQLENNFRDGGQVAVRIMATGLRFAEFLEILEGKCLSCSTLGLDCSFVVIANKDETIAAGTKALGIVPKALNGLAYVTSSTLALLPPTVSFEEAATMPT